MSNTDQDATKEYTKQQAITTMVVATALFSVLYIHAKILWLCLIPLAIFGVIGLPKDSSAKLFKQRFAVFAAALIASFVIGFSWRYLH